jgi:hypothetical protein
MRIASPCRAVLFGKGRKWRLKPGHYWRSTDLVAQLLSMQPHTAQSFGFRLSPSVSWKLYGYGCGRADGNMVGRGGTAARMAAKF